MDLTKPAAVAAIAFGQSPRLKQNALNYFGHLPKLLDQNGPDMAGEVAVALGNFLLWSAPFIDPGESHSEIPVHETATTIHALAKQFRAVGLKHWDKKTEEKKCAVRQLATDLEALRSRMSRMEAEFVFSGVPDRKEAIV